MACSADWQEAAAAQIGKQWAWLGSRAGLSFGLGLALWLGSRGSLTYGWAWLWLGLVYLAWLGLAFIGFISLYWLGLA